MPVRAVGNVHFVPLLLPSARRKRECDSAILRRHNTLRTSFQNGRFHQRRLTL